MKWPCLLNAYTIGLFPYSEGCAVATALDLLDSSLENLNSLTVSFLDLGVYSYSITCVELRRIGVQLLFLELFDNCTNNFSPILWTFLHVTMYIRGPSDYHNAF